MNTFYIISIVNFFDPMTHILCETDGIDVTVYADFDQAINACIESDECSSVVSDQCAEQQKYELCNGVIIKCGATICNFAMIVTILNIFYVDVR